MTGRTIIASIWLLISIVAQDYLSLNIFYQWGVPRAVPSWVFLILLILIVVGIMQFFLFIGFMLAPKVAAAVAPSLYSRTKDPFDDESGRG
jgi:hypothetical protein